MSTEDKIQETQSFPFSSELIQKYNSAMDLTYLVMRLILLPNLHKFASVNGNANISSNSLTYRCSKSNQNVKYNTCPAPFCWSWFHLGQSSSSSWQSRPPPCTCGRQRTRWRWRRSGWRRARRRWPALRSPSPSRCRTLQGSHRPGSQGEAKGPQDTPLPL